MKPIVTFFLICFSISILLAETKDESRSKKVTAFRLINSIEFDGILSEQIYNQPSIQEFTQRDPDQGKPATEQTEVWVSYDDSYLYISARLYDSEPSKIDASLVRRDNMIKSDWFFVYLDPYFDRRTGYYFAVNPGGSQLDGTMFNDGWDDSSWDGIWEAETNINDKGWSLEMRIPFSQLRFRESDDMKWGVNFNRDIKRKNEMSFFVMVPREESGFVSRFATLEGLNGLKPKQRFEVLPYIVQKAQYLVHDADDPFYSGNQYKTSLGADFNIGIGSNLTVNGTINPDFGQVEVDPAVVNLTAFETFYDEKRPFFIEGADIFRFGYGGVNNNWGFNFGNPDYFYSRRIGRSPQGNVDDYDYIDYPHETVILGAGKLTGKLNESWSIGAMSAVTQKMEATFEFSGEKKKQEIEPFTHYGVFRTRKEFDEGKHAVGMIFTGVNRKIDSEALRNSLVDEAYTFGVDGWTTLDEDETYVINGSVVGSYVKGSTAAIEEKQRQPYRYLQKPDAEFMSLDPTRTSLSGIYSRFMLNKQKGNFYINSAVGVVTPGFENNDVGFQWMADRINAHTVLGYRWFEPDSVFRRKQVYLAHFRTYNFDGDATANGMFLWTYFEFLNYYSFQLNAEYEFENYSPTLTRGGPTVLDPSGYWFGFNAESDGSKEFVAGINGEYFRDDIGSYFYEAGMDFTWRPNTTISLSFGPGYEQNHQKTQWIDNFDDHYAAATYDTRYVFGTINQETITGNIRLNWTFTPQLSLQLFIQPLFSVGRYTDFKELARPRSLDFNHFKEIGASISYDSENEKYTIDPDGDGPADQFVFSDPDFNFKSLRGNLVLRYEVLPGSVFYFVWTHDKTNFNNPGDFKFGRDFGKLWNAQSNNVFLAKFSYWFDI